MALVVFSGVLDGLTPAELASVICALTTEDMRADLFSQLPFSPNVRKRLNKIKDIKRALDRKQKAHDVEDPMYINGFYSPLIEMWVNGAEWDSIIDEVEMGIGKGKNKKEAEQSAAKGAMNKLHLGRIK